MMWFVYMLIAFREFVNICVGSSHYVVVRSRRGWCIAIIFVRIMFCSSGSLSAMLKSLMGLWILLLLL